MSESKYTIRVTRVYATAGNPSKKICLHGSRSESQDYGRISESLDCWSRQVIRVVLELMVELPLDGAANYALLLSYAGGPRDPREIYDVIYADRAVSERLLDFNMCARCLRRHPRRPAASCTGYLATHTFRRLSLPPSPQPPAPPPTSSSHAHLPPRVPRPLHGPPPPLPVSGCLAVVRQSALSGRPSGQLRYPTPQSQTMCLRARVSSGVCACVNAAGAAGAARDGGGGAGAG